MTQQDYKSTLNLPQTTFQMKANLPQREPAILEKWATLDLYNTLRKIGKTRPRFILHDGPPYANGQIHLGHAVNKILKDMVIKSHTLSGWDVPYVPGWDCHGLPIEVKVEKEVGKADKKISAKDFRAACRQYAASQVNLQRDAFQRLGVLGDWNHPYISMDFKYEAAVVRSLARIMAQGHLHQGYKPVYWCLECASALAEAEAEYVDKTSPAIDVAYQVVDVPEFLERLSLQDQSIAEIFIPIWTTTPWTLPASQAVALHPEVAYALVKTSAGHVLVVAVALLESTLKRFNLTAKHIGTPFPGRTLEHIRLQHPFYERTVPVVLGEHVTTEVGTGAVHTAPAHGVDDYQTGRQYGLPMENPVADNGCFIASMPLVGGQFVREAEATILNELKKRGTLLHEATLQHSYPHCWRHKTPLIFRATPQWFISMTQQGLKATALASIDKVNWLPAWGANRMRLMINNRPDWCISRQRTWGVPIPLFLHRETALPHPNSIALLEKVAERIEQSGVEAWEALDPADLIGDDAIHYRKSTDILDVWFDSGISHAAVLSARPELGFPADLYLEGTDQYRGWFQSSLLTSAAIHDSAPYRTVLTHGFMVDTNGRKMSKSLGNVIAPKQVIEKLGADVLRLWTASTDYRNEMAVSIDILSRASEIYRRIRNTARFLLANLNGFDPKVHLVPFKNQVALDKWLLDHAKRLQDDIIDAYQTYQFHVVTQKIHHFCSIILGGFYLDIIKDRQYTLREDCLARRSAQTTLFHVLEALVRWMAPILSFTAEEIWQHMPNDRSDSVFMHCWYEELNTLESSDVFSVTEWNVVREVRDAVNNELEVQRQAGVIGSALEAKVILYCDDTLEALLKRLGEELRFVLITSMAEVLPIKEAKEGKATAISGLLVKVSPIKAAKCMRCWHRREDVGQSIQHPGICARCEENINGKGETRYYA